MTYIYNIRDFQGTMKRKLPIGVVRALKQLKGGATLFDTSEGWILNGTGLHSATAGALFLRGLLVKRPRMKRAYKLNPKWKFIGDWS